MIQLDNKDDIIVGDVFLVEYAGINVFLYVAKTMWDQVAVCEIKKELIWDKNLQQYVDYVPDKRTFTNKPLLVTGKNTYYKTEYWVDTEEIDSKPYLKIWVGEDSKLYKYAEKFWKEKDPKCWLVPKYVYAIYIDKEYEKPMNSFYWTTTEEPLKNKK